MNTEFEIDSIEGLVSWLEYKKISGQRAGRYDEKQEELWADLVKSLEATKNQAYKERNVLVCLLSKIFPSWLGRHPAEDKDWEDDWRWIVFIMLPAGQCSWHIHDSEYQDYAHLAEDKKGKWDGHTTEEKYNRIERYQPIDECFFCGLRISNPGHIVNGKLACNG